MCTYYILIAFQTALGTDSGVCVCVYAAGPDERNSICTDVSGPEDSAG